MNVLSIIDKIYENKSFTIIFNITIVILIILFITVLIIGIKDSRRAKNPKKVLKDEDVNDVSLNMPTLEEVDAVKEDVTFELPVLTNDLENFKKNLEEEITKEVSSDSSINKPRNEKELKDATRPIKILDMDEIEDTKIIPTFDVEEKKEQPLENKPKQEKKSDNNRDRRKNNHVRVASVSRANRNNGKYNSKDKF